MVNGAGGVPVPSLSTDPFITSEIRQFDDFLVDDNVPRHRQNPDTALLSCNPTLSASRCLGAAQPIDSNVPSEPESPTLDDLSTRGEEEERSRVVRDYIQSRLNSLGEKMKNDKPSVITNAQDILQRLLESRFFDSNGQVVSAEYEKLRAEGGL
ncbi:hypothetical protein H0H93_013265 [Arthromyces matolae]|nr:hypothetical protein H0H93_013265 [Arthromyces matolae]